MRRVLELSQREVADRLHIHEKAVEKQVARGARLLLEQIVADELHRGSGRK